MNNRLCKGDKIIQGFLDAKNPYDTWVSGTFAIAFWVIDYVSHLAKTNLGLSAVLGGTGMCITLDVLKKHGWRATCLTEDMEFTMKSLAEGLKTTWAHDAIVYDEKPLTFAQSWTQRKRWAQGPLYPENAPRGLAAQRYPHVRRLSLPFAAAFFNVVVVFLFDELHTTFFRHALHKYLFRPAESNFDGRDDRSIRFADDNFDKSSRESKIVVVSALLSAVHLLLDTDNFFGIHSPQRTRMGAHQTHALHELRRFR